MAQKEDLTAVVAHLAVKTNELATHTDHLAQTIKHIDAKRHWAVYSHPWRFFVFSFLNGLFIVLGSTLGLALVLYILSLLGYLPVFGSFFSGLRGVLSVN